MGHCCKMQLGNIHEVNFVEKILAMYLAKLSNFIPDGGIWMNTQRPEWNDANNALVGNGVSMVTLYYLRRFTHFFKTLLLHSDSKKLTVSRELGEYYGEVVAQLDKHRDDFSKHITDEKRKVFVDGLGKAASDYRSKIYRQSFSGDEIPVTIRELGDFFESCMHMLEQSILSNRREDGLYNAYNIISIGDGSAIAIEPLDEMLEGQVAALSSGLLDAKQSLKVLDSLRNSLLYRKDQNSYLLYPNKQLPGFLEKNNIPEQLINRSELLLRLLEKGNGDIIRKDINHQYHFNGNFKNAADLEEALERLSPVEFGELLQSERKLIIDIFESVFDHSSFTGRSGTFFGYEGLGSIYWHMVSKLRLAVLECFIRAVDQGVEDDILQDLSDHYYEIVEGNWCAQATVTLWWISNRPLFTYTAAQGSPTTGDDRASQRRHSLSLW